MQIRKFTVFTPTYNRAHTLDRVYKCLIGQTFTDFEWLIIDDGSNDNTLELVQKWIDENKLLIRYYYQANQGKHNAMIEAIKLAQGELFLTSDSDDSFKPNSLEMLIFHWNKIPDKLKMNFSAVTTLCMNENGEPLSKNIFPVAISNSVEMKFKYHFSTEAWGFQTTKVLRELNLTKDLYGQYIPEGVYWNRIAKNYSTLYINEYYRFYFRGEISLSTDITNRKRSKVALGYLIYVTELFNFHLKHLKYSPLHFCFYVVNFIFFSLHRNIGFLKSLGNVKSNLIKFIILLFFPLGLLKHIYYEYK